MTTFSHVPPGFRFHPTDEELVDYYLRKKVASRQIDLDIIKDVDLYKIEPWDLQELCKIGVEEQNEWYFFSHKDKKYPTGTRTNRATKAGFWKATGRDKAIYMKHSLVGMRKTLVFYQGRAPNGQKSDWIMHEYRLETNENGIPQEEGWVVCRVFKKRMATVRKMGDHESPTSWYDDQVSFMTDMDSPSHPISQSYGNTNPHYACKQELELDQFQYTMPQDPYLQLPQLESPKVPQSSNRMASSSAVPFGFDMSSQNVMQAYQLNGMNSSFGTANSDHAMVDEALNWRVLDKFVASQLSQEEASNGSGFSNSAAPSFHGVGQPMIASVNNDGNRHGTAIPEYPMTSTSSFNVDLWK